MTDVALLLRSENGATILSGGFRVVAKELLDRREILLVAADADGRRLNLRISCDVLEEVGSPSADPPPRSRAQLLVSP